MALNNELCIASRCGDLVYVRALLAHGRADPAVADSEALVGAARRGHAGIVRALLADGRADPAARNSGALRVAVACSDLWNEVVRDLLEDGRADPAAVSLVYCASHRWPLINAACRWRRRRQWLRAGANRAMGG
jgi:hypothetical protein